MNRRSEDREALRDGTILRQITSGRAGQRGAPVDAPSAFEAVTRQMVVDLHSEIQALRTRLDGLFAVVVGAVVVDLLMRLAGMR